MAGQEWDWFQREELIGQISDLRVQNLQVERENVQKRTFTRWMNLHLEKCNPPLAVKDLFMDMQDGKVLMALLEVLSGYNLLQEYKPSSHRIFRLNNIAKALQFLEDRNVKLVNIDAAEIADGNSSITLGLIWNIILFFQIKELTGQIQRRFSSSSSLSSLLNGSDSDTSHPGTPKGKALSVSIKDQRKAIKALLYWVQKRTRKYGVAVQDFGSSWTSGLAFLAIIKAIDPSLVDIKKALEKSPSENLEDAFRIAHYSLGIPRLLEPEDVILNSPDEQSIMTYVSQFLENFSELEDEPTSDSASGSPIEITCAHIKDVSLQQEDKTYIFPQNGSHSYIGNDDYIQPPPPKIYVYSAPEDTANCTLEPVCRDRIETQSQPVISEGITSTQEDTTSVGSSKESLTSDSAEVVQHLQNETYSSLLLVSNKLAQYDELPEAEHGFRSQDSHINVSTCTSCDSISCTESAQESTSEILKEDDNFAIGPEEKFKEPNIPQETLMTSGDETEFLLDSNEEDTYRYTELNKGSIGFTVDLSTDLTKLPKGASGDQNYSLSVAEEQKLVPDSFISSNTPSTSPETSKDEEDAYRYILELQEEEERPHSLSEECEKTEVTHILETIQEAPSPEECESALGVSSPEFNKVDTDSQEECSNEENHSPKISVVPLDLVYYPHYEVPISDVLEAYVEHDTKICREIYSQLLVDPLLEARKESGELNSGEDQNHSENSGRASSVDLCEAATELPVAYNCEFLEIYEDANSSESEDHVESLIFANDNEILLEAVCETEKNLEHQDTCNLSLNEKNYNSEEGATEDPEALTGPELDIKKKKEEELQLLEETDEELKASEHRAVIFAKEPEERYSEITQNLTYSRIEKSGTGSIQFHTNEYKVDTAEEKVTTSQIVQRRFDSTEGTASRIRHNQTAQEGPPGRTFLSSKAPSNPKQSSNVLYFTIILWMLVYCLMILPQLNFNWWPFSAGE
ncbi:calmin [Latimeria chalumnae]|uniref:Calmin n=1 Tax=Latimeria chalumnae TaxID=7897 RepID=M3XK45_LATCH|nr:PREDICTED: calmin [Latimeria chalumnae]|eukprot:XP_006003963.1 PREDICTED: calmin [Latimeria chalumnae]